MTNNDPTTTPRHMSLVTWLATLASPALMMIIVSFPLQVKAISRTLALLDPYSYFILLAAVCLAPSAILLLRRPNHLNRGQVALCCLGGLLYAPVLWGEYLYVSCVLFDDCYNI